MRALKIHKIHAYTVDIRIAFGQKNEDICSDEDRSARSAIKGTAQKIIPLSVDACKKELHADAVTAIKTSCDQRCKILGHLNLSVTLEREKFKFKSKIRGRAANTRAQVLLPLKKPNRNGNQVD